MSWRRAIDPGLTLVQAGAVPAQTQQKSILILAAGGHAKVLAGALQRLGRTVVGIVDADPARKGQSLLGVPVLGDDTLLSGYAPDQVELVNGLGSTNHPVARRDLFLRAKARGFRFACVLDPAAVVAPDVILGEGVQILAGAVVQPGTTLGDNCIVNTRSGIDHDCRIGAHSHIAPGATLSGGITVGEGAHIGAGVTIIQGISIGPNAVVGAGAAVIRDVAAGQVVAGVPAVPIGSVQA